MKAFSVHNGEFAQICFAETSSKARYLAYQSTMGEWAFNFHEFLGGCSCSRADYADGFRNQPGVLEWEGNQEQYRKWGWFQVEEEFGGECATCGLSPCGLEKYGVCEECHHCTECGHDDDCEFK